LAGFANGVTSHCRVAPRRAHELNYATLIRSAQDDEIRHVVGAGRGADATRSPEFSRHACASMQTTEPGPARAAAQPRRPLDQRRQAGRVVKTSTQPDFIVVTRRP
jgi:hypothetical protein